MSAVLRDQAQDLARDLRQRKHGVSEASCRDGFRHARHRRAAAVLHEDLTRASLQRLASAEELAPADLGLAVEEAARGREAAAVEGGPEIDPGEKRRLEQLLLESGGMVSRVAARLGISRQALYRRMQRLGIALERRPRT